MEDADPARAERWYADPERPQCAQHTPWADWVEHGGSRGRKLQPAVRLGLGMVRKMSAEISARIVAARQEQELTTIADLVARAPRDNRAKKPMLFAGHPPPANPNHQHPVVPGASETGKARGATTFPGGNFLAF